MRAPPRRPALPAILAVAALTMLGATGASQAGAQEAGASKAGAADRVTVGIQLEPPILDPTANPSAAIYQILYGNVFEGLVQFAADGSVLPKLASTWDVTDGGLTYVFHLVQGVRFHDGSPFAAATATFSLARA